MIWWKDRLAGHQRTQCVVHFLFLVSFHRRCYLVFSFFFFFFNILVGMVSCLLRILKGMLCGILFIGRIDRPLLMKGFHSFDTGNQCVEALSVLMLCAPSNCRRPCSDHTKMADRVFSCFVRFLVKQIGINSEKCIEYSK